VSDLPMRFAYADPPYYGKAHAIYKHLHSEAAVWDDKQTHIDLIARLCEEFPDGWALSCNPADLRWLLPHTPDDARVAAWTKTFHQIRPTTTQYAWEPVIWRTNRKNAARSPMVRDWYSCARTFNKGTPGAKPAAFNQWVLDLLVFNPALDELIDLFPGSQSMSKAIQQPRLMFDPRSEAE
jgi:hypothetical protein